jgi:MFS family permease
LFFVNIPIGIIAIVLGLQKIPKFPSDGSKSKLDIFGVVLLSIISASYIFGITLIKKSSNIGIWVFALATVALFTYLIHAANSKENAIIPLKLFKSKNFSASFISLFLAGFATNGPMLILPLFFQNVRKLDVVTAALWLIPQGIGMLLLRGVIGKLTDKIGARFVVIPSILITLASTIPFVIFNAATPAWAIWLTLFVRGMGVGGITIPVMADSYVGLSKPQIPTASIATRMIQNIGAAFGSGVLSTVVSGYIKAGSISSTLNAYHAGFVTSLIFMVVGVIPALFLTKKTITKAN